MQSEGERCRTSSRNTGLDGDTLIRWQSGEGELISDDDDEYDDDDDDDDDGGGKLVMTQPLQMGTSLFYWDDIKIVLKPNQSFTHLITK